MRWWLPESLSSVADKIDFLFYVILAITGLLFFLVQGTLLFFVIKYRGKKQSKAFYTHGHPTTEVIWTVIPALILIVIAFLGQKIWEEIKVNIPKTAETVSIRVAAEQYAWNIQYPGLDGKYDTEDDIRNLNQLHIPVGKPVRITLTSIEKEGKPAVIHSFFLPEFRLKQDAVPGLEIDMWFEAKRTGKFEIACAEFCGLGHYRMKGFLFIHSVEDFDAWLKEQIAEDPHPTPLPEGEGKTRIPLPHAGEGR
jgi:cytochrome c oxidase subunit II